jgi:hypothetical protein
MSCQHLFFNTLTLPTTDVLQHDSIVHCSTQPTVLPVYRLQERLVNF